MAEQRRVRSLGELETVIMELLWDSGQPCLVRDVVDQLAPSRPLAYTTVMTVMDNLHKKGWLDRERDGRAWRYVPTLTRQAYAAQLMNDALDTSADRAGALAHFVEQIDAADADVLAKALTDALAARDSARRR